MRCSTLIPTMTQNIEKLRAYPIANFFGVRGGRRIHVRCPFHNDKTPSLVIYPDNSYHCFGCGARGKGAIDFVMAFGSDFPTACDEIERACG